MVYFGKLMVCNKLSKVGKYSHPYDYCIIKSETEEDADRRFKELVSKYDGVPMGLVPITTEHGAKIHKFYLKEPQLFFKEDDK